MDVAELLERARHYRTMAILVTDEQTKEGLLDLAKQYEAQARGRREGAQGFGGRRTPASKTDEEATPSFASITLV